MNKTLIIGASVVALVLGGAIGVRIAIAPKGITGPAISMYVGNEEGNAEFYQALVDEYIQKRNEEEAGSFPYQIKVSGVDLGSIAGPIQQDKTAHADIYSVANDNIGKLAAKGCAVPFKDEGLLTQFAADNTDAVQKVCKVTVGSEKDVYGVPYISQALFLMYDKRAVSEEQAQTFEGLRAAAAAQGPKVKAVEVTGDDGFNFSFTILSRSVPGNTTTVKLYENGLRTQEGTWCQGDDTVAVTKWCRDFLADANGFGFPSSAKWDGDLKAGNCVSVIGGAWHYNTFAKAIGSTNVGTALIPTFTLGAGQGFGTVADGSTFRGGTFADVKTFMMNDASKEEKRPYMQEIVKYLSSREVQMRSFTEQGNIPSYSDFADQIDQIKEDYPDILQKNIDLAKAQTGMVPYGIPQPFTSSLLNNFYYQNGAPAIYKAMVVNLNNVYGTDRAIQEGLWKFEFVWTNGKTAEAKGVTEIPAELPVATYIAPNK